MTKMLGPLTHMCPWGRNCTCNAASGKARKVARRTRKRIERQAWKRDALKA